MFLLKELEEERKMEEKRKTNFQGWLADIRGKRQVCVMEGSKLDCMSPTKRMEFKKNVLNVILKILKLNTCIAHGPHPIRQIYNVIVPCDQVPIRWGVVQVTWS